jgi:hypothetical protein
LGGNPPQQDPIVYWISPSGGAKMFGLDNLEILFIVIAFGFQIILIVHFALRKWYFNIALRYGLSYML